jgi:cobalamin biosynthesis protein CobD/CbiB
MLFSGELVYLNMLSLGFAVSLSWYFGGIDFYLHPDRMIGSLVSYAEKSVFRYGTYKEGLISLILTVLAVFGIASLLLYFTDNAGGVWYFALSSAMIYFSITARFSTYEKSRSTLENYLNYAMPVILYTFLLGPSAAIVFRIFPIAVSMTPVKVEKFAEYGKPTEQTYTLLRDTACLLVPFIMWITSNMQSFVRKLKMYRP